MSINWQPILLKNHYKSIMIEQFRNQVFCEDVLEVLRRLPDVSVNMIYGDPDYNVGINYAGASYTRQWSEYIDWYVELTTECMRVLKPTGNLFMMNYPKANSWLRCRYLDEAAYWVGDYAWIYNTNVGSSSRHFTSAHRSILHATKSKKNDFYKDAVAEPYLNPNDRRIQQRMAEGYKGRNPYSWFYHDLVKNVSADKTFHACQIPTPLVERLIKASTVEGDDVFVLFGGSGGELMLCKRLRRNFISSEVHPEYFTMIQERLSKGYIPDEYRLTADEPAVSPFGFTATPLR